MFDFGAKKQEIGGITADTDKISEGLTAHKRIAVSG